MSMQIGSLIDCAPYFPSPSAGARTAVSCPRFLSADSLQRWAKQPNWAITGLAPARPDLETRVVRLQNNLACPACRRRPVAVFRLLDVRFRYAFVGGPCQERRRRRMPHRHFADRPLVVEWDIASAVSSDYRHIRPESGTGFVSGRVEKAYPPAPSRTRTSSKPLWQEGSGRSRSRSRHAV